MLNFINKLNKDMKEWKWNENQGKDTTPTKQVEDPPIRRSSDIMLSCMSDFCCRYLSRQFGFCFLEAIRVLVAEAGKSDPSSTQAVNTTELARKETIPTMLSEKYWW